MDSETTGHGSCVKKKTPVFSFLIQSSDDSRRFGESESVFSRATRGAAPQHRARSLVATRRPGPLASTWRTAL